jgi:hypothetical protein
VYLRLAPNAADQRDQQYKLPISHCFGDPALSVAMFHPFIRSHVNPVLATLQIVAELRSAARRKPGRRVVLSAIAEELEDIAGSILSKLESCSTLDNAEGSKTYPFSSRIREKAILLPEDLDPATGDAPPGPLALAVQASDLTFCAKPFVASFVDRYWKQVLTLEAQPTPDDCERPPLSFCGLFSLPKTKDVYATCRNLTDDGEILWPEALLETLYATALISYRPGIVRPARSRIGHVHRHAPSSHAVAVCGTGV